MINTEYTKEQMARISELENSEPVHPVNVHNYEKGTKVVLLDGRGTRAVIVNRIGFRYYEAVSINGLQTVKSGEFEVV